LVERGEEEQKAGVSSLATRLVLNLYIIFIQLSLSLIDVFIAGLSNLILPELNSIGQHDFYSKILSFSIENKLLLPLIERLL